MKRALSLLVVLSACSTDLGDPPTAPPASVRERLEEPTRLLVAAAESGGSITAERKVATGWDTGLVELGIENGELIVAGQGEYFEVWTPALWNEQMAQLQDVEANNARFSTLDLSKAN